LEPDASDDASSIRSLHRVPQKLAHAFGKSNTMLACDGKAALAGPHASKATPSNRKNNETDCILPKRRNTICCLRGNQHLGRFGTTIVATWEELCDTDGSL